MHEKICQMTFFPDPTKITHTPKSHSSTFGSNLYFTCKAETDPKENANLKIKWFKVTDRDYNFNQDDTNGMSFQTFKINYNFLHNFSKNLSNSHNNNFKSLE